LSYQDILDEKDESVKNAKKFVNFIKANFSNYEIRSSKQARLIALLNEENDLFDRLNRTNFAEVSKRLGEIKEQITLVILDIKDGVVKTTVKSSAGSMDDEIEAIKTGKDLMIAFNPKFLIDALKVIDDEYIDIYMTNSKAPCFIRDSDGNYTYLVLPVNFVV